MDGTEIFSFTSPGLISPADLAIYDLGILFVAGFGSFNIHQLKLDGTEIKNTIILKKEDGVKKSKALSFNKDRSQLYIANKGRKIYIDLQHQELILASFSFLLYL